jgi:hypothetical protein
MAKSYPTLLDMAIRNGRDRAIPLIEETSKAIPEISGINWDGTKLPGVGAVRTIDGINYETLVRVQNPQVSFRNANEPATLGASIYENRLVSTFIINPRWQADKAVADRSEDGPDAYIADEAMAMMEATMQSLGAQFYYGRGTGDSKGHPGLIDAVTAPFTLDAGGTAGGGATVNPSVGTAINGSVWFVKFGVTDVQWIFGKNGALTIPDKRVETIYLPIPGTSPVQTGPVTGYVQEMLAYPGVQVGSVRSIFRIKNVTQETGHTLTDNLLAQAESAMYRRPDVCFMHPALLEQLRESRTTFNPLGTPAPTPTMTVSGIPIAPTRSLRLNELV